MRRALDYAHMPPPGLPLGFLVVAPWFGVVAGLVAAWYGGAVFASRWNPATLAVVHFLTLGFLTMTMAGSLLQILPAVAGLPLRCPLRLAVWICPLLGAGGTLLAAGFLSGRPILFAIAWALLAGAFALLFTCLVPTLCQRTLAMPAVAHIVAGMRGAVAVLAVCIAAGLALAAWLAGGPAVPVPPLVDSHAALGFAGWVAPLVMAVGFQVIPMFQGTDPFSAAARRCVPLLFLALAAWVAGRWLDAGWRTAAALAGALVATAWALQACALLLGRARTRSAPGTAHWLLSLASLVAAAWLFAWPGEPSDARTVAVGAFFLAGFAMTAVHGMLYRIVPFLVWHHLREHAPPGTRLPKFADLIGPQRQRAQWWWHGAAVVAALGACVYAPLAPGAGLLLAAASVRVGLDVGAPVLRHRRALRFDGRG
ncbi:hypothetical protein NX784_20525 [Massilia pinisoli]|uniref:Permease n=1 Tax=Massilia pinisoli TaxID=1772194 RepID=A0ABT1ZVP6_9BURK|nr:hypothetical protein [Massilia pinisoli]MCS0583986.1 hypothetical protein [Massilia pinisoli]